MDDRKTQPDDPGDAGKAVKSPSTIPPLSPTTQLDSSSSSSSNDIPSRVFRFLATATVESLTAVGVGLAATTYLVLGRVGLVLIGAVGGIALFAAWQARNPDVTRAIHGETSSELLSRVIQYRKKQAAEQQGSEADAGRALAEIEPFGAAQEELVLSRAFENFRPETRQALDNLVDAVVRDYVEWWYQPIVPADRSFPLSCRRVLTSFLVSVSNHLSRKRPADVFLDFLTNSSSIIIVFFSEVAAAFAEHTAQTQQAQQQTNPDANPTISAADTMYNYLASNPDSNLANLLSQGQQATKFRLVAEDLLSFVERQCYDCEPARLFLREIAATSVLESTLQACSKPEWINGWIVYLLEAGEPDFSQAIDVGMQTRPETGSGTPVNTNMATDIDGNVGNVSLSKGQRNSSESDQAERPRRKELAAHKKQLSRADEEMEEAIEEMKRMNQMIAAEDARRATETKSAAEAEERLADAMQRNADELEIQPTVTTQDTQGTLSENAIQVSDNTLPSAGTSTQASPKASVSLSGDECTRTAGTASTPITPRSSTQDSPSQPSVAKSETEAVASTATTSAATASTRPPSAAVTPATEPTAQFTNFDQLVPPAHEEEDESEPEGGSKRPVPLPLPPLTLHNASVTIHDEPTSDKGRIKNKPTWDFLIQIEPAKSHYPGWMIVRKYSDFEKLHEVLRRIATISGATAFTEQHGTLPNWKVHTRGSLHGELERYVRDACWYQSLAESEGMKRFLEKDTNNMPAGSKLGFQAFEAMGKNMLDVLSNAPKGVAEGGKVVVGGVTGVLGNIGTIGTTIGTNICSNIGLVAGQKKHTSSTTVASTTAGGMTTLNSQPQTSILQDVTAYTNRLSVSTPPRADSVSRRSRDSMDSQRSSVVSTQPGRMLSMERRMSYQSQSGLMGSANGDNGGDNSDGAHVIPTSGTRGRTDAWDHAPVSSNRGSQHNSRASSSQGYPRSPSTTSLNGIARLPSGIAYADGFLDDSAGGSPVTSPLRLASANSWSNVPGSGAGGANGNSATGPGSKRPPPQRVATSGTTIAKQFAVLTEGETRVAVELLFAVINELYTLSSAWNIRRTLLTAAKSFLLRPGNPSLASIQSLMQTSVLDANTTDSGMASYLRKLRENVLPTEAERAAWPAEMTADEKERQRIKARRLLIQSGVPAALMGVMGQSATSDALGRVFDCLQIEEVARGLIFGLMLQAARVVTH